MSCPSIENFDVSFISRTSENLKDYKGKYEFTMLLNSLLGLIIVPNERKETRGFTFDFWNKKLIDFTELKEIFSKKSEIVLKGNEYIELTKFWWLSKTNQSRQFNDIKVGEFIKRMRNSIAHFGIIPLAKPCNRKEWCGVILQNFRDDETKNFEVCLMEDDIKLLSTFITKKYLSTAK